MGRRLARGSPRQGVLTGLPAACLCGEVPGAVLRAGHEATNKTGAALPSEATVGKEADPQTSNHKTGLQGALRGHRQGDRRSQFMHLTLYFGRRYFPRGA